MPPSGEGLVIDFNDAPPAQGGGRFDHVPSGTYVLAVEKGIEGTTSTEKPMVDVYFYVSEGDQKGRKLRSMFVIPRAGTDDSRFGVQRLNALVVACGLKAQGKKVKASSVLGAISGKKVVAVIEDRILPPTGSRSEMTISDPTEFYSLSSEQARAYASARDSAMTVAEEEQEDTEPEAEAEEEAEIEEESEAEVEEEEEEKPKAKKKKGKGKAKEEPEEEEVASSEDDLEGLFD